MVTILGDDIFTRMITWDMNYDSVLFDIRFTHDFLNSSSQTNLWFHNKVIVVYSQYP